MHPFDREQDVRIPADAADQLTTNARSAIPPSDFNVTRNGATNLISIRDRVGVQGRASTASYRIYFLPASYAPESVGTTYTVPKPATQTQAGRLASRKVASLVTDISAPGLGTILTYSDSVNVGQKGYYYCVAVNQSGVEAPVENMIATDSVLEAPTSSGSGGGMAVIPSPPAILPSLNGITLGAVTLVAGPNIIITPSLPTPTDITIEATGGGGASNEDMRNALLLMGG